MDDTAQPMAAETPLHEQIASAADAMKQMRATSQPRDDAGRFAAEGVPPDPVLEGDEAEPAEVEEYDEPQEEADGPDEDQPEAVEMPKSWKAEKAELWGTLPADAQAYIAERDAEQNRAVNSKFEESANVRKAYEAKLAEANSSRDKWAQEFDLLIADLALPEPDPRQFGLGTGNYNREAYDMAVLEWKQGSQQIEALKAQREEVRAQQQKEQIDSWNATKQQIDAEYTPKIMELMPDLRDAQKAEPAMRDLVNWGIQNGLRAETFSEENQPFITAADLRLLAMAKKYADLSDGASKPAPKKQPVVRPGVATPRSAQKRVQAEKAMDRLQSENSIDAAVAAMRARRR